MFNQAKVFIVFSLLLALLTGCESAEVVVQSLSKQTSQIQVTSPLRIGFDNQFQFLVEGLCQSNLGDLTFVMEQNGNQYSVPGIPCSANRFSGFLTGMTLSEGLATLTVLSFSGPSVVEQVQIDLTAPQVSFSVSSLKYNSLTRPTFSLQVNELMTDFYPSLLRLYDANDTEMTQCEFVPISPMPSAVTPVISVSVQVRNCTINGFYTIRNIAGAVSDRFDNLSAAGPDSISLVVDLEAPSVTFTAPTYANGKYIVQMTANEPIENFDDAQLQFQNGRFVNAVKINDTSYHIEVDPVNNGEVRLSAIEGLVTDVNGNPSAAVAAVSTIYDSIAPDISLISQSSMNGLYWVSARSSEPITGLVSSDFTCTNCTIDSIVFHDGSFDLTIKVQPTVEGVLTLALNAGTFGDLAGNFNAMSRSISWTHDSTNPTVSLMLVNSSGGGPFKDPLEFQVNFSEPVMGFDPTSDLAGWGGTFSDFQQITGAQYRFKYTPAIDGLASVSVPAGVVQDQSSNANSASNSVSFSYDSTEPSILSVTLGAGSFTDWHRGTVFEVTVMFSEAVQPLEISDLRLSLSPYVQLGAVGVIRDDAQIYRFQLEDVGSQAEGIQKFSVIKNNIFDMAGNQLDSDSVEYEIKIDNIAPSIPVLIGPSINIIETFQLPNFSWASIAEGGSGSKVPRLRVGKGYGGSEFLQLTTVSSNSTGVVNLANDIVLGEFIYPQLYLEDFAGNVRLVDLKTFRYLLPVTLTSVSPSKLIAGQQNSVRIEGTNFVSGTINVLFNYGNPCSNVNVISNTVLFCDFTPSGAATGLPVVLQRLEASTTGYQTVDVVSLDPCGGRGFNEVCADSRLRSLGVIDPDSGGPLPARRYVIENTCDVLTDSLGLPACGGTFSTRSGVLAKWDSGNLFDLPAVPNYDDAYSETLFGSELSALIFGSGGSRFDAVNYCRGKSIDGFSDWYLPSATEFIAIAGLLNSTSVMDQAGFSPVNPYWTASEYDSGQAWSVQLNSYGGLTPLSPTRDSKLDQFVVRCVRSY